jgi:dTDP-4-amino-4,6-dideoxygalactose transaminase
MNAYSIVSEFERRVAEYAGSQYAVAVDCCTNAIFLCLKYINKPQELIIPARTYVSVPMAAIHAGYTVKFEDIKWQGEYQIQPLPIIDGAKRFRKGMYHGGLHCLSFHLKKLIDIGRGGMVLTDDENAYKWLKKARYDGRDGLPYDRENIDVMGWHMYMTPEQAARGLALLDVYTDQPDQTEDYPDLRGFKVSN